MNSSQISDLFPITEPFAVVLLNMGGPENQEAVKPFLFQLFKDPELIQLPKIFRFLQKPLAKLIAEIRSSKTKKMYSQIGGGSPILRITEKFAKKIENRIRSKGYDARCFVAMRYTPPRASDVIREIEQLDIKSIVLFSQYPHYSKSTSGSSIREFIQHLRNKEEYKIVIVDEWEEEDAYISWWVRVILEKLNNFPGTINKDVHLLFSAHGLPQKYIDNGEMYLESLKRSVSHIIKMLGDIGEQITHHLSYQSRAGPIQWTQPYTDDKLREIATNRSKAVIIVPLGFVSNHVETLFEIDIQYKHLATSLGIEYFERVEVPDADDEYTDKIVKMLISKVSNSQMEILS